MSNPPTGMGASSHARSHRAEETSPSRERLHPGLESEIARLEFDESGAPEPASWTRFVTALNRRYIESDRISKDLVDATAGWSSFENLFRISPIPIMEQDYTELVEWMDELRAQGVTSIRDHLGEDIEAIRAIVPKIKIVAANPAAVTVTGVPIDDLIGPIDPRIVNEGSLDGWLTQLDAVWEGEAEGHASFVGATASGKTYDAESILAAPLIDGKPDYSRAVLTIVDVTPHREEERRMQDVISAKNQFLASVSHEIRTPLTAIHGFARLLIDDADLSDEDRHLMVTSIAELSQEMADLIDDLLVAARAEMGDVDVSSDVFDVKDVIAQILGAGGSFTDGVTIAGHAGPTWVVGDPTRVRQIVRNLLTNAERYGGPNVSVVVGREAGTVYVDVVDDGPGVPIDQWEKIFEPYHRLHDRPGRPGSVGIGLAISRQLAERMGGALKYQPLDRESRFRLTLRSADGQAT